MTEVPALSGNSMLITIAVVFTLLILAFLKPFFQNGESGPKGSFTQRGVAQITFLNSLAILAILWTMVAFGLRFADVLESVSETVNRFAPVKEKPNG